MRKVVVPVEVYSRVSGYFRPVNQWNKGKREEYSERRFADINKLEAQGGEKRREE